MKLAITVRHLVMTDADRSVIVRRVGQLDRILNDHAVSAECEVSKEREQFICAVTVRARGHHVLRGTGHHRRLATAAGAAAARASQQAQRLTGRRKAKRHDGRPRPTRAVAGRELTGTPAESEILRVIRVRGWAVNPMSIADAAVWPAESKDPVLVFRRKAPDALAVICRRADGNFGLVEPEA